MPACARGAALNWINPEVDQGFGLSATLGVAGFPSAEASRLASPTPMSACKAVLRRRSIWAAREAVAGAANRSRGQPEGEPDRADPGQARRLATSSYQPLCARSARRLVVGRHWLLRLRRAPGVTARAGPWEWYQAHGRCVSARSICLKIPNGETLESDFIQCQSMPR